MGSLTAERHSGASVVLGAGDGNDDATPERDESSKCRPRDYRSRQDERGERLRCHG
jgi:hypothetical protein